VIVLRMDVVGAAGDTLGQPAPLDGQHAGGGAEGAGPPHAHAPPAAPAQQQYGAPPAQYGDAGGYGGGAHGGGGGGGYGAPAQYGAPGARDGPPGGGFGGAPPAYGGGGGGGYGAPPAQEGGYGGGRGGYGGAPAGGVAGQGPQGAYGGGGYGGGGGGGGGQALPQRYNNAGGAVARNESSGRTLPLNQLNPYQNRWTIKVRVTSKSDIKTYHNDRGEGKLCSFDVMDEARARAAAARGTVARCLAPPVLR
jgi:hypothetical protein